MRCVLSSMLRAHYSSKVIEIPLNPKNISFLTWFTLFAVVEFVLDLATANLCIVVRLLPCLAGSGLRFVDKFFR